MARKVDPIKRLAEEQRIIDKMIALYCRDNHRAARGVDDLSIAALCPECRELRDYTKSRNDRCPFIETRSFCRYCQAHCYRPDMRSRISVAMRYSGPRMMFHEPLFAIKHLREQRRQHKMAAAAREQAKSGYAPGDDQARIIED